MFLTLLLPDKDDLGNFADRSAEAFMPVTLMQEYIVITHSESAVEGDRHNSQLSAVDRQ